MCSGVDLVGLYYHTQNYSPLPIHYVVRAGRRRRGERTKAEDKVLWPMCWAGLGILIKNKNGPELFTTLTMICMGPLVAGRKWWEKKDRSLSLPKNNID